jgi:uncharacterized Zn finger protein
MDDNDLDLEAVRTAVRGRWPFAPGSKALPYVKAFFDTQRQGKRITGKVVGNHGTYTVSVEPTEDSLTSACSCYIGKRGYCHHCEALALAFLSNPNAFEVVQPKPAQNAGKLEDVRLSLESTPLASLLDELKAKGITQKEFAASVGMNTRHLSAIKSSEARNRGFNELGATKLACLWVLEHFGKQGTE